MALSYASFLMHTGWAFVESVFVFVFCLNFHCLNFFYSLNCNKRIRIRIMKCLSNSLYRVIEKYDGLLHLVKKYN